jgi:hypothetical protein
MKQEMDNAKMHEGENLTYIPISISLSVRMDRHGKKVPKKKCLQSPI